MNVISILQKLVGLSPQTTSLGSCLQQKNNSCFEKEEGCESLIEWPESDAWVLARELILYDVVDLHEVPKSYQSTVLSQKIRQLTPFSETGHYVFFNNSQALLWIWDENSRLQSLERMCERYPEYASHFRSLRPVPETLLQARYPDGKVVQKCVKGADEQLWKSSLLVASRWMPPSTVILPEPAGGTPWDLSGEESLVDERLAWRVGLLVLVVFFVFQIGEYAGWALSRASVESDLGTARAKVSDVLDVRKRVQTMRAENERLLSWMNVPSQIGILADFDELLRPATVRIIDWSYEAGQLEATIESENLENRAYLESLSAGERFVNVRVEPGVSKNTAVIKLEVVR